MIFEWDNNKSASNKQKHGISFEDVHKLWDDALRVEIQAAFPDEKRHILIGKMERKVWTAIYTMRGESIRIISVRPARDKEKRLYEQG